MKLEQDSGYKIWVNANFKNGIRSTKTCNYKRWYIFVMI